MLRKIAANKYYTLIYDQTKKTISLIRKNDNSICLRAKFFHDTADGAAVLSDFYYFLQELKKEKLVQLAADMVSDYLSQMPLTSKLFCWPGEYGNELAESENYRSSQIDRLMVREKQKTIEIKNQENVQIEELTPTSANQSDVYAMVELLKQTYWASDADESYLRKALENSHFLIARNKENNIIGLVRVINNGHVAYISDMVVDNQWRKQGIATGLMQHLCQIIDEQFALTALISAREGDGKEAAPRLYGEKFGFVEYDKFHHNELYFRYIRRAPIQTIQHTSLGIVSRSGLLLLSNRPSEPLECQDDKQCNANITNEVKHG